jgi:PST family polysaccharide transporter
VAAQGVLTRCVALVQQLALAWLLAKEDFGLIGLAYTVMTFVNLLANPGVDAILVQRSRKLSHWATPAFWLGQTMGVVGAVVMLALAPVAGWAYDEPRVIGLISVLAVAAPIQALHIVPKAMLQTQMRFRALVSLGLLQSLLMAVLTIVAAVLGFGAYSFAAPVPLASAVVAAASWRLARPQIGWRPESARWKYLFGNSATVGATKFLHAVTNQADYIALGLMGFSDAVIGTYVFAFNMAIQPLRLISANIPVVLFPGLSHLASEPEKQVRAALRAMRLLTLITTPFCLLQIVLSEPVFRLVFPARWLDAVLPCQILTLGLMFNAAAWPAHSLMMAQGRFRELLWVTLIGGTAFLLVLGGVMWLRPTMIALATAVAVWHFFNSPFLQWAATRDEAGYFRETWRPLLAGLIAAIPCVGLQILLPATLMGHLAAVVLGALTFTAAYVGLVYVISRAAFVDMIHQLAPILRRVRSK